MEEATRAPLARYTTIKIGGEADRLCHPQNVNELVTLVHELRRNEQPWYVIGGGSNLLVSSAGVTGTVIRTTQLIAIKTPEPGILEAEAGARLPHLARQAAALGLSGLEFAVGIPGTVGGGVIMNAGAHGSQMSAILETATVLDSHTGEVTVMSNSDLGFQYRRCLLDPSRHVVLSARFKMPTDVPEEIEKRTKHNEDYRWKTQPMGWPNAGSTFKNPQPDKAAGFLLDQAGVKNLKEGQAAVSAIHANFVINLGGATSHEVTTLMRRMQESVHEKFDLDLIPEWKTMGSFTDEELSVWRVKK
ncbi:MAG: UDP-N-acetylmuramate dehydrogenase [Cyanobacteria bacterium SZAS TMP-1]|nr:UDP-N-acetylmuramate dehydrogenase [Cyanobacteria bacterium SZAS TMP-1]